MMWHPAVTAGEHVVEQSARTDVGPLVVLAQRKEERCRSNEMRCNGFEKYAPFGQCLSDQGEVSLFEVAEAAVHKL